MSKELPDLHAIIIVTEKANHSLHYKEKATATAAFNQLQTARKEWAAEYNKFDDTEQGHRVAQYEAVASISDDYGVTACPRFSSIVTVQVGPVSGDHEIERTRNMLKMLSDLKYGEQLAANPELLEAQRKAQARSTLVRPN